jgi:hypothetical protein
MILTEDMDKAWKDLIYELPLPEVEYFNEKMREKESPEEK